MTNFLLFLIFIILVSLQQTVSELVNLLKKRDEIERKTILVTPLVETDSQDQK